MKKNKRVYLLPHNDTYKLINSFHTGGIDGEGFLSCDNCNALISRVAVVKCNDKNYHIGFDCAKTLTSIKEEDVNSHLQMFKLGESTRKSLLNSFNQTAIAIIGEERVSETIAYISMITDNMGRTGFNRQFTINDVYNKYILPQVKDLFGTYIFKYKIEPSVLEGLYSKVEIGMETKGSYKQRVVEIGKGFSFDGSSVKVKDVYMGEEKECYSTHSFIKILPGLLWNEPFKEFMEELRANSKHG